MAERNDGELNSEEMSNYCPMCWCVDLDPTLVDEVLKVGNDTVALIVEVTVCRECVWKMYSEEETTRMLEIESNLSHGNTEGMEPVGTAYRVS